MSPIDNCNNSPLQQQQQHHQQQKQQQQHNNDEKLKQINEEEQQPLNQNNDDDDDDDDDEITEDADIVVPPDGGWGWVVVFASFMCNMIVDGIIYSFGVFLKPIAETFLVSEAHVALVGSLMSGFYLIVGPLASALANRYGFRLVAIVGSILASIAFTLSYFATNVQYLCVTFGVLGGIGFGFIYMPAVVTVGFYFERWRALATGIGVCGSGIGTFLFAPITSILINNLGWRTALLCQAGVTITCILFGLLFRPLKPIKVKGVKSKNLDCEKLNETRLKMEKALKVLDTLNNSNYPRVSDVYHTIHVPQHLNDYSREKRLSIQFVTSDDKVKGDDQNLLINTLKKPKISQPQQQQQQQLEVNRPMYRDDIFFSASLTRLPQYQSKTSIGYNLSVTRLPTRSDLDEEKKKSCKLCPVAVRRTLKTMLDFSLLKSPTFLVLAFGGFLTMMGFYVPFMYLSDRAKISGIDQKSAIFLISSIGIANTIGRVLCGILSSFPGVNALFVTNCALTIGGLATIFSGFSMEPEYQFTYTAIFGLSISCFASLRSIIVVDLLGLEKLTNAFGLLLLFQGIAAVIGAPLAGAFKVATGSYDASFYLSGSLILASAIMCYPLNFINRWEMKRNSNLERNNQSVPV